MTRTLYVVCANQHRHAVAIETEAPSPKPGRLERMAMAAAIRDQPCDACHDTDVVDGVPCTSPVHTVRCVECQAPVRWELQVRV